MHFVLQTPSLQHLAGVKIVVHLWNRDDILTQITRLFDPAGGYDRYRHSFIPREKWTAIEDEVKAKVWALPLPELQCKQPLVRFIKPIRKEMEAWCSSHNAMEDVFVEDLLLPNNRLRWTMHGTVDHQQTAELMVKDERVDLKERYALACLNGLEDEARQLFYRLGQEAVDEMIADTDPDDPDLLIMAYITYTINGDVDRLNSSFNGLHLSPGESTMHKYLFFASLDRGSRALGEYFFAKLSQRGKEQVLEQCPHATRDPGKNYSVLISLYYWSLLSAEQRERMFRKCTYSVLKYLSRWPAQALFVETVRREWGLLTEGNFSDILYELTFKIRRGSNKDYDYFQLFRECWRLGPAEYKRFHLNKFGDWRFLFDTRREEFIKFVFNEAPLPRLKALVLVEKTCDEIISPVLLDESVICDAALMECKETAALVSSKDSDNMEKRLRSEGVIQLIDLVMKSRNIIREEGV